VLERWMAHFHGVRTTVAPVREIPDDDWVWHVGLDAEAVTGIDDIARILDGSRIDKRVSIRILREERLETVDIVPTERLPER
jgi:hypothetical protein